MVDVATPQQGRFHLNPDRFVLVLLAGEGLLLLSEWFQWFGFNERKGWAVLITTAGVLVAILFMVLWFVVSVLLRRRFQFGIRSLLVLTLVVAIPCSWLAVEVKKGREQREVAERIEKLGGTVTYQSLREATPPGLDRLAGLLDEDFLTVVITIDFQGRRVGDAALEHVEELPQLRTLHLWGTGITDAGLARLKGLTQLRSLDLSQTEVTDAGLESLEGLRQLQSLTLCLVNIGDSGLVHLSGLRQLHTLCVWSGRVSDAGMEHLKPLQQLQKLELYAVQVTPQGVKNLRRALPDCKIDYPTGPE